MTDGGEGVIGLIHTEDHRKKNSDSNKGKKMSEEFVKKQRNRIISDETKLKISVSDVLIKLDQIPINTQNIQNLQQKQR